MLKKLILPSLAFCMAMTLVGCTNPNVNLSQTRPETAPETSQQTQMATNNSIEENKKATQTWFKDGIGSRVPAFTFGEVYYPQNSDEMLNTQIINVAEQDFKTYLNILKDAGYNIPAEPNYQEIIVNNGELKIIMTYGTAGDNIVTMQVMESNK